MSPDSGSTPLRQSAQRRPLLDVLADELARNDACGPGPVSRQEYIGDARALLAEIVKCAEDGDEWVSVIDLQVRVGALVVEAARS